MGSMVIVVESRSRAAIVTVRLSWRRTATQRPLGVLRVRNGFAVPSIAIWGWERVAARAAARRRRSTAEPQGDRRVGEVGRVGVVDLVVNPLLELLARGGDLVVVGLVC